MWASDHDLWDPTYVSVLAGMLDEDPRAVLAYSETMLIDEHGRELGVMDDYVEVSAPEPAVRYMELIGTLGACNMVYGLARRQVMQSTWGVRPIFGPDFLLLSQLSLRGTFARRDEPLFRRRQNRPLASDSETAQEQLGRITGEPTSGDAVPESAGAGFTALRDEHLDLLKEELKGYDRVRASLSTRLVFRRRFGVPDPAASTILRLSAVPGRLRRGVGMAND